MKFEKEFLQEMEGETVYDKITGNGRWSISHERVFSYEGKFYRTKYRTAATESQDEQPYEHEGAQIECPEVFPVEETAIVYKEKP